jgi:hypothetical protein
LVTRRTRRSARSRASAARRRSDGGVSIHSKVAAPNEAQMNSG